MPGKARAIADQLELYESHLTADFQRVYHIRLIDAILERSYQEILDLITWLPKDSAFMAAHRANGDAEKARKFFEWGMMHELILANINLQLDANWMYAQAHSKKTVKRPEPISGPAGETTRSSSGGDANFIARAMLAKARGG